MARTIFDPQHRAQLEARVARLTPTHERRWGRMNAPQMICHLQDSLECALGMKPTRPRRSALSNPLLLWLIIYVLPWPKGRARSVPEMLTSQPGEWAADVQKLNGLLRRAAEHGAHAQWARHPAFGNLRGEQYGHLIYRHFHHHLTQFGV